MVSNSSIKISVLLFYRRLSTPFTKVFYVATWIGIGYNICFAIWFVLVTTFLCDPIDAAWNRFKLHWIQTHHYNCSIEATLVPLSSALNTIGDLYATVLPLLLIVRLKLPLSQRLSLYGLFALGFLYVRPFFFHCH